MKKKDLDRVIHSIFKEDIDKKETNSQRIKESIYFPETECFIMTIKSLKPEIQKEGNIIHYDRFEKELSLWRQYRHNSDKYILRISRRDYENYCDNLDSYFIYRCLGIVLSNEKEALIEEEVIRNISFFTGNPKELLKGICILYVIIGIFNKNEKSDIIDNLKKKIVDFSLKDKLLNKEYFGKNQYIDKKKYTIEFERYRVKIITDIHMLNKGFYDYIMGSFIDERVKNIIDDFSNEVIYEEESVSKKISEFLWKLRKGRISPESFLTEHSEQLDFFKLKIGEENRDSLLGKVKLIDISFVKGYEIRYIQTRLGILRFFKIKNGK